jgi:hypothetical protein
MIRLFPLASAEIEFSFIFGFGVIRSVNFQAVNIVVAITITAVN